MPSRENSLMYLHLLILVIISPLFFSCIVVFAETNTLNQSDSLNFTGRLVSNNQNFTLEFVKPIPFSNNTYLAIWNSYESSSYPVWLANRDNPITDGSATLFIDNTGKFVINQTHGDPIQLCPGEAATNSTTNTKAVLLDNGNLVLTEVNSDGSVGRTLWQSFDCPTDHLLPGMKLGINHRTGRNWSLTSWLAYDDPSPGAFTLEWDPHGLELVLRRRGVVFWTSGGTTLGNIEQLSHKIQSYEMSYTKTSDEEFFNYSLKQDPMDPGIHESIEWILDYEGSIWFNNEEVALQDYCYGYEEDVGCAKWEQLECRSENTRFELLSGYFVSKRNGKFIDGESESIGPADCRASCWNDCNCQAYLKSRSVGCVTYHQEAEFQLDPSGNSQQHFVIQQSQNKGRDTKKRIAISVPISLLSVSVIVIILYRRWKTKGRKEDHLHQSETTSSNLHDPNELGYDDGFSQHLKMFTFVSIVEATDDFSVQNKLGEGGFGPVYKGKLPEGVEIAVKRLSRSSGQGLVEFKNELILIAKLQHKNLVRLLGCCMQSEEKMLVYEYMPNKSLDSFLFDASKRAALNWKIRVMIIEGISQGLLYLHQHSRLRIIHRDLKTSNILLDIDMNPKISDFGMARIFKENEFIAKTNRIVGTYGYMSPEYAMDGIFSIKSDVFSLGVIILEILSGKRNSSFYEVNKPLNLIQYAWDLWQNGVGLELMDPILSKSCSNQQFLRFIQISLLCVEESPANRPTTSEVISMITNERTLLPIVKKPAFTNLDCITNVDGERNDFEYRSAMNNLSISTMNGR
ncbi:G-type lectin S-receptor-like serine/threonine-protein kinase CES101 isoform X1 [Prosopis cineraria]|uniref:G-type lectin S-receptor-like serine/threonine-protein kinase CES101 isoform X1 n=2 Tax=Prosopis cineraria TaxID=364024 RepID=UPI00240F4396|nr:G-type lectin S-receptor-like serine/threonine-protein kinase CES101 isoform X1 [Prosopis cineraria]